MRLIHWITGEVLEEKFGPFGVDLEEGMGIMHPDFDWLHFRIRKVDGDDILVENYE